ncbi:MAG: leucine-rich repeat domain-containing protein, partial [Clostridia bacterium]|nr:leucine-rich repeat domain-containing protein [Clostridia bacterium]
SVTIPSSVTSIGYKAFYNCTSLTSVTIPSSVTSIGYKAFYNCTSLTSVIIPSSVTSIGEDAFSYCNSLVYNEYDNGYYLGNESNPYLVLVKAKDTSITSCIINENTRFIHSTAFSGCTSLTSVTIPNSIKSIGNDAFAYCDLLTSVTIPDSVTAIGNDAFYSCDSLTSVIIGNSVTSIGDWAFYGCDSLTSITIGSGVTSIGKYAFENCTSLKEVHISDIASWCNISFSDGSNPLYYAKKLYIDNELVTNLVIPDNVTSIGDGAFFYCTSLTSITIGDSITSIGYSAFCDCTSLTSLNYLGTIEQWCNISFSNYTSNPLCYANKLYINNELVTNLVIPDIVTKINNYAFYGCTSLTDVTIGNSVTSVGYDAFSGCTSLESVTIENSVTSIVGSAFRDCTNLTEIKFNATAMNDFSSSNYVFSNAGKDGNGIRVIIGKNVTKIPDYLFCPYYSDSSYSPKITSVEFEEGSVCEIIGNYAFSGCTSLESVTIGNSVTSIGDYAFYNCTNLTEISFKATAMSDLSQDNRAFTNAGKDGNGIKVIIGKNVTKIPAYLFYPEYTLRSPKITSVVFEEGSVCESIGSSAFRGCTSLTSVTIGNSVTSIGSNAFYCCSKLAAVYNSSSLNITIGSTSNGYVGYYAKKIISGEFENIDGYIFQTIDGKNCLVSYVGEETEPTLPESYNGNNYEIYQKAFYNNNKITKVTIPNSVTSIGGSAFYNCASLTSVTIPNSVTSIGYDAFSNCTSLTSITIPDSVTSIGESAFEDCTSLTSVTIPSSVTSIGSFAFYGCDSLTSITFENTTGWYVTKTGATSGTNVDVTNATTNATYLTSQYYDYYWYCNITE